MNMFSHMIWEKPENLLYEDNQFKIEICLTHRVERYGSNFSGVVILQNSNV